MRRWRDGRRDRGDRGRGLRARPRSLVDVPTVAIGLATLLILTYVRKVPEPLVILAAGLIGLGLKGAMGQ